MLRAAIEAEVADYIEALKHKNDEDGHRLVVRNSRSNARQIETGPTYATRASGSS